MKSIKPKIIGAILFILSFVYAFGMTYVFDAFKGSESREFIIVLANVFGTMILWGVSIAVFLSEGSEK